MRQNINTALLAGIYCALVALLWLQLKEDVKSYHEGRAEVLEKLYMPKDAPPSYIPSIKELGDDQ